MTVRRRALVWALAGVAVHVAVSASSFARAGGNIEWFVHFGRLSPTMPLARQVLGPDVLVVGDHGHDGKQFWVLARDPGLTRGDEIRRHLDRPAYRAQRILYPALAAPWRVAGERALLWGLLVTNLAAVLLGGYVTALLALQAGGPAWAALAFALNPAVFITVQANGADAVALAALLTAALLLLRHRDALAVTAASAAALAKEPSLLAVGGMAVLAPGVRRSTRVALLLLPAAAAAAWGLYARWRLGWPGTQVRELALPFTGYVEAWRQVSWPIHGARRIFDSIVRALVPPFAILVVLRWLRERSLLTSAALPFALIVPFLSVNVLRYATGSLRALAPAVTFVCLDLLVGRFRRGRSAAGEGAPRTR